MIEENSIFDEPPVTTTTITTTTIKTTEEVNPFKVSILAGGLSSLGSQDSYSITPTASIETSAGLGPNIYIPSLLVKANLSSLPGSEINLQDATSFKTLEFEVGLEQRFPVINAKLYGGFGIATRLPGEDKPRVNVAKYFTAGVRFATREDSSYLYVGAGPDQRLDPRGYYVGCAHIAGQVEIYSHKNSKNEKDIRIKIKGDAILGGASSLVRVGVVLGV
jgi:hypothetical protein